MTRVCLGDVAREIKQKAPAGQELPTVGLEHLDPGEVELVRWDEDAETTFTKAFSKGQVLFGRRRAYLRKAAVAPFDGVCSGDITVIAAKSNLSPRLLPFIIQNGALFEHAVTNSAGSLSPRVKWQSLSQFEFELPSICKQEELADILWAEQETRSHYRQLLTTCDDIVKSQFVEMFINDSMEKDVLGNVLRGIVSGVNVNGQQRPLAPGEIAVLKISSVTRGTFDATEYKVVDDPSAVKKIVHPKKGDLLFSRANTREMVGAAAIVDADYEQLILPDKLWRLDCGDRIIVPYLKAYLSIADTRRELSKMATGTSGSMFNISMQKLKSLPIPVPPLVLQQEFASFADSVDKSKFRLGTCGVTP